MIETSSHGTSYQLHGPENHPVVALVHGLGLSQETWNGHAPELAKNYRVLTYDLFGHSDSIAPPTLPSVTLFSDQLRDLMDELNIYKAAIVCFSLGGMINRRFARDYPDRASALVVLNSPHDRGEKAQKLVEQQAADSDAGGVGATLNTAFDRYEFDTAAAIILIIIFCFFIWISMALNTLTITMDTMRVTKSSKKYRAGCYLKFVQEIW